MACNSLLYLVNLACSDYLLADHLHNGISKQSSSLTNMDPVTYNYINNALAEARLLGCLADSDVVACLSPAYASIDSDRQSAPVNHALLALTNHNSNYPKHPQFLKSNVDKKASSVIKELQNHLDQCQATIAHLLLENEAMVSLAQTLGSQHDQVSEAVYLAHEAHLAKVLETVKDTHLH